MAVILILILASITLAAAFFAAFIWAVRTGQFEDTCTPSMRILAEEPGPMNHSTKPPDPSQPANR